MRLFVALAALLLGMGQAFAEEIGSVSTTFNFVTPNDKIVIEAFDDPAVTGVSCYLSRAKTGGLTGLVGIAEDTSDASVACRQVGDITITESLPQSAEVFSQKASLIFKTIHVMRVVDPKRRVLVYLVYSNKLVDGSPKNSVSAVPIPANVPLKVHMD
jgi:CreA protein